MTVDLQRPVDVARNFLLEFQDRFSDLIHRRHTFRRQRGGAGRKQNFRFKHEAVADDADILAILQQLPQSPKEVRAIALQLLHLLRQRRIEARAEILDRLVAFGAFLFCRVERVAQARDLPAQRNELLIQKIDFRERFIRDVLLRLQVGAEPGKLVLSGLGALIGPKADACQLLVFRLEARKRRLQCCKLILRGLRLALFEREHRRQLADLPRQALQRGVFS